MTEIQYTTKRAGMDGCTFAAQDQHDPMVLVFHSCFVIFQETGFEVGQINISNWSNWSSEVDYY